MPIKTHVQVSRSSVAGARPASGSQPVGSLYVNFADKQLGVIDPSGNPVDLLGEGSSVYSGDTPPTGAVPNALWYNTTDGFLYIYYDDGNSVQWVSIASNAAGGGGGGGISISTDAGNQTILGTDSGVYTPLPTVVQIGAAPASHTHTAAQITDFAEAVDDRAAALIKAGANVSVTYDDAANTLTIAAAGGGGSAPTISTDAGNQSKLGTDSGVYTPLPTVAQIGAAPASHTHVIGDVTGLQTALNGKAPTVHTHVIADVTGLQTALDGKAPTTHTHTAAQITDFAEAVDDRAAALIKAGTNTTVTYDDALNTLTIDAATTRTIDANDALPGLRITQTGTGHAILVEDNTSPDATPFAVSDTGVSLFGSAQSYDTTRPQGTVGPLLVQVNGSPGNNGSQGIYDWNASIPGGPSLVFSKSGSGTLGVHAVPGASSDLGSVVFNASDGTTFRRSARITAVLDGTPTTNGAPGRLDFTVFNGGNPTPGAAMSINKDRAVAFNSDYGTAGQALLSNGSAAPPTWGDATTRAIDANDALPGLRVTQTGTGAALLIEDSTSPDTTPFAVTADGVVISGHTVAYNGYYDEISTDRIPKFQTGGMGLSNASYAATNWSTTNNGSGLILAKSKSGTIGAHSPVVANDYAGTVYFSGSDGQKFTPMASVTGAADLNASLNSTPGRLIFSTTAPGGTVPSPRLVINSSGAFGIGGNAGTGTAGQALISNGASAPPSWGSLRVIEANDTEPGLRVTQTGTGPALRVEDSATPDASPFMIDTDGRLLMGADTGYNTVRPGGGAVNPKMQQHGMTPLALTQCIYDWSSGATGGGVITLAKAGSGVIGTHAAAPALADLGELSYVASDGTAFRTAARMRARLDGPISANSAAAAIELTVFDGVGAAATPAITINSKQAVAFVGDYGTSGYVLRSMGSTAAPQWDSPVLFGAINSSGTATTVTPAATVKNVIINRAATTATLTVTLPLTGVVSGQEIVIWTRSAITSLTVNVEGGGLGYNLPTALAVTAGTSIPFVYHATPNAWFKG